jgi:hypothetical protein
MAAPNITDADLIEAREQADAGLRLAFPQLAERAVAGAKVPGTAIMEARVAEAISDRLASARQELIGAMKLADLAEDRALHVDLGERVNGLDDLGAVLAERWAS